MTRICAVFAAVIVACTAGLAGCTGRMQGRQDVRIGSGRWVEYRHPRQGFRLRLPSELRVYLEKQNDREWAAQNMMPFDYVNFRPQGRGFEGENVFELGLGVHWNRDRLGTREFADKKDDGLRSAGARIEIIRQARVTVAGIAGVRDDFRIRQPSGWTSYSRIVFSSADTYIVLLCTTGADRPVAAYERVFRNIADGFVMPQESLDRGKNPL
ncbi:MAG: hypothetical protein PHS64_07495 [Candidatus Omnitrophica bacterium]|nr:hypothetical protein [Candidatus Omnitrophota bacterium]MDD5775767.1 hypothetical protein [Candidatus Omnitrophota bacterium]